MKLTVGLTFYIAILVTLTFVARDRSWWWGSLLTAGWIVCLVTIIGGRKAGWFK